MNKRLTEKDISEGEQIQEIIAQLPEKEKKQALVYLSALRDRSMLSGDEKAG